MHYIDIYKGTFWSTDLAFDLKWFKIQILFYNYRVK